jgi:hypothetical protein
MTEENTPHYNEKGPDVSSNLIDASFNEAETLRAQITQLQQQQAIFTRIIASQLEGKWTGEGSAEAWLYALDPNLTGTLQLDVPVTESEHTEHPKA